MVMVKAGLVDAHTRRFSSFRPVERKRLTRKYSIRRANTVKTAIAAKPLGAVHLKNKRFWEATGTPSLNVLVCKDKIAYLAN